VPGDIAPPACPTCQRPGVEISNPGLISVIRSNAPRLDHHRTLFQCDRRHWWAGELIDAVAR